MPGAQWHARCGKAQQVVALAQSQDLLGGYVAFDELAVDHRGVAGAKAWRHAQALFHRAHVGFNVVVDLETVALQVADPLLAAAAVGVAVYIDGDQFGGLGQGGGKQGTEQGQSQWGFHRGSH